MRVVAVETCFVDGSRRRPGGPAFEFDLEGCKPGPDGKKRLPACLRPADDESKAEVASLISKEQNKLKDGMIAAAGPKRGGKPALREVGEDLV